MVYTNNFLIAKFCYESIAKPIFIAINQRLSH